MLLWIATRLPSTSVATRPGVSVQAGESDYAVACIAAPVLDESGACPITVSIVLPEFRVNEEHANFVEAVKAAARRIEEKLGWRMGSFAAGRKFG